MEEKYDVVIAGAGASGLMCAWQCGRRGKKVLVIEKNEAAGKKILASGNGRCNFTNRHMQTSCYHGDKEKIGKILEAFPADRAIQMLEEIGIYHKERDGYLYPYTGQAVTVRDFLVNACRRCGVQFLFDAKVTKAVHKNSKFLIYAKGGVTVKADALVLACGGKANKPCGGDGSGYLLARSFGHEVTKLYPALTGLKAEGAEWETLAGVRMPGAVSLWIDGKKVADERGEIQIVKDGISGIPVFQLCSQAAAALDAGSQVICELDFLPDWDVERVGQWMGKYGNDYLQGIVHKKWVKVLEKKKNLAELLKHYPVKITDTFGMERAQVTAGGVPLSEVGIPAMESKKVKNLYLTGELLDADGICGGYNLHFAWATGYVCARQITADQEA